MCAEWRNDSDSFIAWVMSHGYRDDLSIDRIDNDLGYYPSNCRWVDMKTQCNNRRNTLYIKIDKEIHTISEWSDITGINRSTLNNRYYRGDRGKRLIRKTR